MAKWKPYRTNTTIETAISDGKGDLECLREEMTEWRDNMEQNEGLAATEKFAAVEEAAETLENACNTLEEIDEADLPDNAGQRGIWWVDGLYGDTRARWRRLANVVTLLRRAEEELGEKEQELRDEAHECESEDGYEILSAQADTLERAKEALTEACDELDNVEFPGMFG